MTNQTSFKASYKKMYIIHCLNQISPWSQPGEHICNLDFKPLDGKTTAYEQYEFSTGLAR